jgi:uncharacterized repeat protein (TIGR01451 family)
MSDSNQDSDRDPRFTRALLGRIVAVGLFVALGTFAVIQMMSGNAKTDPDAAALVDGEPAITPESVAEDQDKTASLGGNSPTSFNQQAKNSFQTSADFKSAATPPSLPPTKNRLSAPDLKSNINSFAVNAPPTQNGFDSGKSFAPHPMVPAVTTSKPFAPSQTSPFQADKPPTQPPVGGPPVRFAARPDNGVPIIANNSGFAERPKPPVDDRVNAFGGAATQINETAKQLGNNLAGSANDLLEKAKEKANLPAESLRNGFSGFEPNRPPVQPGQPPNSNNFMSSAPPEKNDLPTGNFADRNTPAGNRSAGNETAGNDPVGNEPLGNGSVGNAPTMTAPVPKKPALEAPPNLRPVDNGFNEQGPTANTRLRSFPTNPSEPTVQSRAVLPKANSGAPNNPGTDSALRSGTPAQPASTSSNGSFNSSSSTNRVAMERVRTANVPGDQQLEGVQAPALTVEKLSPREIQVNNPAEFEIVIRNVGRVNAEDVQVHDQIPAGTEFLGSSPEPTQVSADRRINWDIGALRSGQEKRIKFQLKPIQPGEIGSVAHVTFATQASMRTLVTKPVLEVTHQTKPKVLIGDDVILDVIIQNKGDGPAKDVLLQEDVPPQLEYQSGYRELEYEIGTLMPGQSKRVQLGLTAAKTGRLKNLILVTAAGGLRAQSEIEMEVISPKLVTGSDGPTRRFLQREVTHQFSVGNQGTAPATNVDLIARLPAGLRFVSADNRGVYKPDLHSVFWSLAELGLDVTADVQLVTMPVEAGSQDIKFEAVADLNQKSVAQQKLSVEHLVDVFFDIDDVVDPIEIGADTSYRIRVVNQGTKAATNVQLQVEFPQGLVPTGVDGSLQHQIQGQRIEFAAISSLNPGDQLQLVVTAKGQAAGDHRVIVKLSADGRQTGVSKEESTRVYADR